MRAARPDDEQCGALEHELRRMRRRREPMQKTLVRVAREEELKILTALAGKALESGADRSADILQILRHHGVMRRMIDGVTVAIASPAKTVADCTIQRFGPGLRRCSAVSMIPASSERNRENAVWTTPELLSTSISRSC